MSKIIEYLDKWLLFDINLKFLYKFAFIPQDNEKIIKKESFRFLFLILFEYPFFVSLLKSFVFIILILPRCIDRMRFMNIFLLFRIIRKHFVVSMQLIQFFFGKIFNIYDSIACFFIGSYKLVQLDLDSFRIFILSFLNQKDHKKGNNGCSGINHQLPSFGIISRSLTKPTI